MNRDAPRSPEPPAAESPLARLERFVLGEPPPRRLGRRSLEAIEGMHASSEILVCCLQFGAVAFFGAVYAITPKAFPPEVPFEPVPAVLALYALITAIRLGFALAGRLTRPFVLLSAVVDVAVLMITIWSFHLQYGVEPAVYLKAPTLLYVFILIAVRALRLEAGPVVAAGIAAVLGWGALFGYALEEAGPQAVTRNWAVYMTSARILVGAEVDKLLAIASTTGVLAVAVTRARRLMLREAAERRATEDLSRFFAPGVAETIREADLDFSRPGARREATVLMVDLAGFSELSARMSAEETLAVLADYHARVVPLIHAHGGAIDKYLGDGILATFGAVRADADQGRRGLAALAAILEAGAAWAAERRAAGLPEAAVRAAMDRGPVTLGVVGVDGRYEFTIIGDVVNRVAKLEKLCRTLDAAALVTARAFEEGGAEPAPGLCVRRVEGRLPELGDETELVALDPRRPDAAGA